MHYWLCVCIEELDANRVFNVVEFEMSMIELGLSFTLLFYTLVVLCAFSCIIQVNIEWKASLI